MKIVTFEEMKKIKFASRGPIGPQTRGVIGPDGKPSCKPPYTSHDNQGEVFWSYDDREHTKKRWCGNGCGNHWVGATSSHDHDIGKWIDKGSSCSRKDTCECGHSKTLTNSHTTSGGSMNMTDIWWAGHPTHCCKVMRCRDCGNTDYAAIIKEHTWEGTRCKDCNKARPLPQLKPPVLTLTQSATRVQVNWTNQTGASAIEFKLSYPNSSSWDPSYSMSFTSSYEQVIFTHLSVASNYKIQARFIARTSGQTHLNSDWVEYSFRTLDKPGEFNWNCTVASGKDFLISAQNWMHLQDVISAWREVWGLEQYDRRFDFPPSTRPDTWFTYVYSGDDVDYRLFNQMVQAVKDCNKVNNYLPSKVSKGDTIFASDFNKLKDAVNRMRTLS